MKNKLTYEELQKSVVELEKIIKDQEELSKVNEDIKNSITEQAVETKEKPNILYIDDEQINLILFRETFKREYQIFLVDPAFEGLDILKQHEIQLIISDQSMPKMTGLDLFKITKKEFPDIPRIVLSAYKDENILIEAINSGDIYRYFTKPWNPPDLKAAIDNGLQIFYLKKKNRALLVDLQKNNKKLKANEIILIKKNQELSEKRSLLNLFFFW